MTLPYYAANTSGGGFFTGPRMKQLAQDMSGPHGLTQVQQQAAHHEKPVDHGSITREVVEQIQAGAPGAAI